MQTGSNVTCKRGLGENSVRESEDRSVDENRISRGAVNLIPRTGDWQRWADLIRLERSRRADAPRPIRRVDAACARR
jgi:hypothetical protein